MTKQYQTDDIKELATALAKAQAEINHAVKDVDNTFFKSKYADLPSVINAAKPHLAKHGLSVTQITDIDETGKIILITQLSHASGQWMRSWYPVNPVKNDPQGLGSAITYARRYAYCCMTGVAASADDDDGNAASGNGAGKNAPECISTDQAVEIDLLITEVKADKAAFLKYMRVSDVRAIPLTQFKTAMELLGRKRAAA